MDKTEIKEYLTLISKSVRIMLKHINDIDVLRFYTGEILVISQELTSIFAKAD